VHPYDAGDASGTEPSTLPECHDPALDAGLGLAGTPAGSTSAIFESSDTFFLVTAPPDVGPVTGDPHRLGRMGHGPSHFDAFTETQSTFGSERGVTVHLEASLESVAVVATHSPRRLQLLVDPVSKVCGHYS
jgi:hypothetical protein